MWWSNLRNHATQGRLYRWLRTLHTVRYLQPRQAWYFLLRRGLGYRRITPCSSNPICRSIALHPLLKLTHAAGNRELCEFEFLNRSQRIAVEAIDWNPQAMQRLWRYNLHYFDYLREERRPLQEKQALIDAWIAHNPPGAEPGWEPYTASLRIVNWCLFFWSLPAAAVRPEWLRSLYDQARWLEKNLELHILANHYFENIKALLFAAMFFADRDATRWLKNFQQLLREQLREQTLADGGHYERSPQYHCLLLEGYLELFAVLGTNAQLADAETLKALRNTIERCLRVVALLATPDDDMPLFNDSASGIASRPSVIIVRARSLGFQIDVPQTTLIDLPDTGLYGWKSGRDYFLIDCGEIGPAYQPGHTHCDMLSYVLMIDGQWLVVDSGVCEYEPGAMRQYVRSTAAHNTIQVDGQEQSEIWGEFRVGRRASKLQATLRREANQIIFVAAYRGFPVVGGGIVHQRSVVVACDPAGNILEVSVADEVSGDDQAAHHVMSLLHLHPALSCTASEAASGSTSVYSGTTLVADITGLQPNTTMLSWHCAQFGLAARNSALQSTINTPLPVTLGYRIKVLRQTDSGTPDRR